MHQMRNGGEVNGPGRGYYRIRRRKTDAEGFQKFWGVHPRRSVGLASWRVGVPLRNRSRSATRGGGFGKTTRVD